MPASKIKITKNDILLFLANKLEGEKAVYISNVDEKLAGEVNSVVDKEIKETLAKYRRVDSVLSNAADTSFEMPVSLENKINAIMASKTKIQKKTSSSIFDKLSAFFNAANLGSLLGGGAAATLGMLSIIQIQPDLLMHRYAMRDDQMTFRQGGPRGLVEDQLVGESGCGLVMDGEWVVSENFLVQIPICKSSLLQATYNSVMSNGKNVNVGETFRIFILPVTDIRMKVTYQTERGLETNLLSKTDLKSGKIHEHPAANPFEFTLPTGQDTIVFDVNGKNELKLKVNIE